MGCARASGARPQGASVRSRRAQRSGVAGWLWQTRGRTFCMRTYGFGPRQSSHTMGKSLRSHPSASGSRSKRCAMLLAEGQTLLYGTSPVDSLLGETSEPLAGASSAAGECAPAWQLRETGPPPPLLARARLLTRAFAPHAQHLSRCHDGDSSCLCCASRWADLQEPASRWGGAGQAAAAGCHCCARIPARMHLGGACHSQGPRSAASATLPGAVLVRQRRRCAGGACYASGALASPLYSRAPTPHPGPGAGAG